MEAEENLVSRIDGGLKSEKRFFILGVTFSFVFFNEFIEVTLV